MPFNATEHTTEENSFNFEHSFNSEDNGSVYTLTSEGDDDVTEPGVGGLNINLYQLATHISSHEESLNDSIQTAPSTPVASFKESPSHPLKALTSSNLVLNQQNGTDDSLDSLPDVTNPEYKPSTLSKTTETDWKEEDTEKVIQAQKDEETDESDQLLIKRTVKDFKFGKTLGVGSYSNVILATDKNTDRKFAVKVLDKRHIIREKKVKYVNIEKNTLNRLGKRNGIIHLFFTFQDEASLYFVLDYAENGELLNLIKQYGTLNEETTRYYGAQILDAVKYMHINGVVHRDLKPENILLDSSMRIQITDFGTAKLLERDENGRYPSDCKAKSFVGTAEYVSPELLNEKAIGKPCDIWAFGCIIYQMIAGKPPFKATNEYLTFQKIIKLQYAFTAGFPMSVRDLIKRILVKNPDDRLSIREIQAHHFFQSINFNDPKQIWDAELPTFGPYKISAKAMLPIPGLDTSTKLKTTVTLPPKRAVSSPTIIQQPYESNANSAHSLNQSPERSKSSQQLTASEQVLLKAKATVAARKQRRQEEQAKQQRGASAASAASAALSRQPNDIIKSFNDVNEQKKEKSSLMPAAPYTSSGSYSNKTSATSSPVLRSTVRTGSPVTLKSGKKSSNASVNKVEPVKPMTRLEIEFADYLKNIDERIVKKGDVYLSITNVDVLERKYRGKLVDAPLGISKIPSSRLLQQVANGSVKGLRNLDNYQYETDEQVITSFNNGQDSSQVAGSDQGARSKLRKFFSQGIHHEQDKKSRTLIVTTCGRALIFGRDPKTDELELRTEINLLHPVIRVKELLVDVKSSSVANTASSVFVIQSYNTACLFEAPLLEVSKWTQAIYNARCAQIERETHKKLEEDPSGGAGTVLGSDAAKSAASIAVISSPALKSESEGSLPKLKSPIQLASPTFDVSEATRPGSSPKVKPSREAGTSGRHEGVFSEMVRSKEENHKELKPNEIKDNGNLSHGLASTKYRTASTSSSSKSKNRSKNPLVAAAEAALASSSSRRSSSSRSTLTRSSFNSDDGIESQSASRTTVPRVITGMNSRLLARSHRKR